MTTLGDLEALRALMVTTDTPAAAFVSAIPRPAWQRDALCAEPAHQKLDWLSTLPTKVDRCKAVCARCLVRAECLTWAVDTGEPHGTWGGMTAAERRKLRRTG